MKYDSWESVEGKQIPGKNIENNHASELKRLQYGLQITRLLNMEKAPGVISLSPPSLHSERLPGHLPEMSAGHSYSNKYTKTESPPKTDT